MQNLFLQFLEQTGLTQAEAAKRAGCTRQYINGITKGGCSIPQLVWLAEKMGYTVKVDISLTVAEIKPQEKI